MQLVDDGVEGCTSAVLPVQTLVPLINLAKGQPVEVGDTEVHLDDVEAESQHHQHVNNRSENQIQLREVLLLEETSQQQKDQQSGNQHCDSDEVVNLDVPEEKPERVVVQNCVFMESLQLGHCGVPISEV